MDLKHAIAAENVATNHRRILSTAVCATIREVGFTHAESASVETLVELLQAVLVEIGRTARGFCELAGRTEPLASDVTASLVDLGLPSMLNGELIAHAFRADRTEIKAPLHAVTEQQPRTFSMGKRPPHFGYIPDYMPPFPDAYLYHRTPTHRLPITDYEEIREKAASQRRDVERALTRFMARTAASNSSTMNSDDNVIDKDLSKSQHHFYHEPHNHSLFVSESLACEFPLIPEPIRIPHYLDPLLPKDQDFDPVRPLADGTDDGIDGVDDVNENIEGAFSSSKKQKMEQGPNRDIRNDAQDADNSQEPTIDNPFMRSAKIVKRPTRY